MWHHFFIPDLGILDACRGACIFREDVWMFVVMKLFAVALVCCMSMPDAWKWAIAFSLGMAMLAGLCQPYMWPQAGGTV